MWGRRPDLNRRWALPDFHAQSSMTWSREALLSYLYGFFPEILCSTTWKHQVLSSITMLTPSSPNR
jgi:hypothetical protein